jgi:hypothetical protein
MAKTVLDPDVVEMLARVLKPFAPRAATALTSMGLVLFDEGHVRLGNGVLGVDAPFTALSGVALPAIMFTTLLAMLKPDVALRLQKDHVLGIAGRFCARLPLLRREATPAWPTTPPDAEWLFLPETAWSAAQSVSFAAGKGPGWALSLVKIAPGQVLASDGVRVARAAAKSVKTDLLLPAHLIKACGKAFRDTVPDAVVPEAAGRAWLRFGDVVAWSLLPEEDFPSAALTTIVAEVSKEVGPGFSARWSSSEARAALARVALFTDQAVTVKAEGKALVFSARSPRAYVKATIAAEVKRPFEIDADPALLDDALGRADCCAVPESGEYLVFRKGEWELIMMTMRQPEAAAARGR